MPDPLEGLAGDGTIVTGAARECVPAAFEPVIRDVVAEFERTSARSAELHLYGSVATGQARPGWSDVDLLAIDVPDGWAADVAAQLSARFSTLCRAVEIATAHPSDYSGHTDESYGNKVFLRHYCVPLAGPDAVRPRSPFQGDARAARGFNGDLEICLRRWRGGGSSAQRVARKTLVAAAGIVSMQDKTWTTDRATAAAAWERIAPHESPDMRRLVGWAGGSLVAPEQLDAALGTDGIVRAVTERFANEIGLWSASRED